MAPLKRPRPASVLLVLAAVLSVGGFLVCPAIAAGKTGQITVFWGRHADEGTLRQACDFNGGIYTTVIMSYLNVYRHGKYRLDLSGHPLAGVGDDIKHCQSLGVPVFLSIGGDHGLPTNQSALELADHLWYSYLGGDREDVPRPFGDARLDGIDFFLEPGIGGEEHYDVLARELAKRSSSSSSDDGKINPPVRLTATPRCAFPPGGHVVGYFLSTELFERINVRFVYPGCDAILGGMVIMPEVILTGSGFDIAGRELAKLYKRLGIRRAVRLTPRLTATPQRAFPPDGHVGRALATGLFERIHVRFYDYPNCTAWMADAWDAWTAAYPASKIFLGLTASEKDACYLEPKAVFETVMPMVQRAENYGGVMLWDRYSDEQNVNQYSSYVKSWA